LFGDCGLDSDSRPSLPQPVNCNTTDETAREPKPLYARNLPREGYEPINVWQIKVPSVSPNDDGLLKSSPKILFSDAGLDAPIGKKHSHTHAVKFIKERGHISSPNVGSQ
jgi:hypothetical protein